MGGSGESCGALGLSLILGRGPGGAFWGVPRAFGMPWGRLGASWGRPGGVSVASWGLLGRLGGFWGI